MFVGDIIKLLLAKSQLPGCSIPHLLCFFHLHLCWSLNCPSNQGPLALAVASVARHVGNTRRYASRFNTPVKDSRSAPWGFGGFGFCKSNSIEESGRTSVEPNPVPPKPGIMVNQGNHPKIMPWWHGDLVPHCGSMICGKKRAIFFRGTKNGMFFFPHFWWYFSDYGCLWQSAKKTSWRDRRRSNTKYVDLCMAYMHFTQKREIHIQWRYSMYAKLQIQWKYKYKKLQYVWGYNGGDRCQIQGYPWIDSLDQSIQAIFGIMTWPSRWTILVSKTSAHIKFGPSPLARIYV